MNSGNAFEGVRNPSRNTDGAVDLPPAGCTSDDAVSALHRRIDNDFIYHAPSPRQQAKYALLRDKAREFAHLIAELVPVGREQSTALTRLEEAIMHANAGIARRGE